MTTTASTQQYKALSNFRDHLPSSSRTEQYRDQNLSRLLRHRLDRVNVLGDDDGSHGHTGCVNALSWAHNGELLLSGGDDTTVRLWRMDSTNTEQEYPFVCRAVINTGHRANIFNAQLLPHSTRLVTVAGDKQVRISDINIPLTVSDGIETEYSTRQCSTQTLRCHKDRVKRIVTEDSPALFLTVSEDGTVRQHDLRTPHTCGRSSCPTPLCQINHDLSSLSLSSLTPYQFVVAGESPYGYLFDRRNIGRRMQEEWGLPLSPTDEITTCVRRFGRPPRPQKKKRIRDHITGSRMSNYNGHEVLLSYSGDAVYLYSTLDDTQENSPSSTFTTTSAPPEIHDTKRRKLSEDRKASTPPTINEGEEDMLEDEQEIDIDMDEEASDTSSKQEDEEDYMAEMEMEMNKYRPGVPIIMPRQKFVGARNVETVKDVNFLDPHDQLVVSGSDDGNFFIWDKATADLKGIYEGDGSVVNVIEQHPSLPLLAVSGIDTTVKLFAPARGPSLFSRIENADEIMKQNARPLVSLVNLQTLLAQAIHSGTTTECIQQ